MAQTQQITALLLMTILVFGCRRLSRTGDPVEIVLPATEVGTPVGDAVTKTIGPDGGSLTSSDERMTLTVPPGSVTGPVTFSIQPITNKVEGGVGVGYRIGPNGSQFAAPLQISFGYQDNELQGTGTELCQVVYQDSERSWRTLETLYIDENNKVFTASTTHFSDMSLRRADRVGLTRLGDPKFSATPKPKDMPFLNQFRVSPEKATIHAGESVTIRTIGCEKGGVLTQLRDKLLSMVKDNCYYGDGAGYVWIGYYIKPNIGHVFPNFGEQTLYTTHRNTPTPSVVQVITGGRFTPNDGSGTMYAQLGVTEITIIDRGYRATGSDGPTSYSGTICSLNKPFTIIGTNGPVRYTNTFTPSSATEGTAISEAAFGQARFTGGGPYQVEGADTDHPRIVWNVNGKLSVGGRTGGGGGPAHIELSPLDTNECGETSPGK